MSFRIDSRTGTGMAADDQHFCQWNTEAFDGLQRHTLSHSTKCLCRRPQERARSVDRNTGSRLAGRLGRARQRSQSVPNGRVQ